MKLRILAAGSLAVTAALLPALAAHADTVSMTIAPTHGVPGTALVATIAVEGCEPEGVEVTGSYVNVDGEQAATTPVQATSGEGGWTANLVIPQDAARTSLSEEPVTFVATPDDTCSDVDPTPTPTETSAPTLRQEAAVRAAAVPTGSATVIVDDLAAAVLTVDPGAVAVGSAFDYTVTGCVGGIADFYLEDNDEHDFDIAESTVTSQSGTTYEGTMTVPANAVVGDAGVFVECTQAGPADAALLLTADDGSGGGAPVATPVGGRPTFTG